MDIELPYLVNDLDRHGNLRVYVRRHGVGKIRMRDPVGSPAFMKAYDQAVAQLSGNAETLPRAAAGKGTLGWLVSQYVQSHEFKQLAERGQRIRRQILEDCCKEPLKPGSHLIFRDIPLSELEPKHIKVLRDRKAKTPGAANAMLKYVRVLLSWGLEEENDHIKRNVAKDVKPLKYDEENTHAWTVEEVAQFKERHPPGTKAHLALSLLLFTGLRRSDAVRLGPSNVKNGWITITPKKTKTTTGNQLQLPVLKVLQAVLDAGPVGKKAFLETTFNKPFTSNGFGNWFRDRCDEAKLPQCSAHGLRVAGAEIAAENGATEKQLMAIFGWSSPKMAAHYTKKANQKKLAGDAMHLIAASPG